MVKMAFRNANDADIPRASNNESRKKMAKKKAAQGDFDYHVISALLAEVSGSQPRPLACHASALTAWPYSPERRNRQHK
jgi:hypothetical protein